MRRSQLSKAVVIAVAVLASAMTAAACSGNDRPAASAVSPEEALHYVTDFFAGRGAGAMMDGGAYRTLDELVPNVTYVGADGRRRTGIATHVVVGRITEVRPGKGFRVDGDDAPDGIATDFDDGRAKWWTMHATVRVEKTIATPSTPEEITVMFASNGPSGFARMRAGLKSLGRVLLFLRTGDVMTAYDPSVYWLIEEPTPLLATVADNGALAMPFMPEGRDAKLLAKTPTLASLEDSARLPKTIVMVPDGHGGENRADGL